MTADLVVLGAFLLLLFRSIMLIAFDARRVLENRATPGRGMPEDPGS